MSPERKIIRPEPHEFQRVIKYKEFAKSPTMIVKQTNMLLELLYNGALVKTDYAKDYIHDYSFLYVRKAEEGADTIYDKKGEVSSDLNLETTETAHHAFVVFAHLPDKMTSNFLPDGFSRKGMVRAPETKDEFMGRLEELKVGLWQVLDGGVVAKATLEAHPRLLRTYGFFSVGSKLPIRESESEQKKLQMEKEKFEELIKDVKISL
jgi:hypothetical protein